MKNRDVNGDSGNIGATEPKLQEQGWGELLVENRSINPNQAYAPREAADLLGVTEGSLLAWGKEVDIPVILIDGSRRYLGRDLLQALGEYSPLHRLPTEILPRRCYSDKQAAQLLGGVDVEAFRQWSIGRVPAIVIGDNVVYLGQDLLKALGATRPTLERIELNAIYTRSDIQQLLRLGKEGVAGLIKQGILSPVIPGRRRQLFLGVDILRAIEELRDNQTETKGE